MAGDIIGFAGVTGAPVADVSDKMGEDVGVVELDHGVVSEDVHVWLESSRVLRMA